jgi:hypothetical protein
MYIIKMILQKILFMILKKECIVDKSEIESLIEQIRASAIGLSNSIEELKEEQEINMWDEILDYLKEKRELQDNG